MPSSVHDTFGFSEVAVVPATNEQLAPAPGSSAPPVCGVTVQAYVTGPSTSSEPEPSSVDRRSLVPGVRATRVGDGHVVHARHGDRDRGRVAAAVPVRAVYVKESVPQ